MQTFTGCLEDTRSQEQKDKDWYKYPVASGSVEFKEKSFEDLKTFPVRNQDGSGSCVAQSLALILGIENYLEEGRFIEFSAKDIYTRRTNSGMGMIGVEALEIVRKYGATLEVLIPSQNMGETEINIITRETSDLEIAKIFQIKDYKQLPFSVDSIAEIMESGRKNGVAKPVMVWFEFPRAEWDAKPQVTNSTYDLVRHSVTAIDYGTVDGKKGIFIQDSWGLATSTVNGRRFISEDYIKARMIFCAYVNDKLNDWQGESVNIPSEILKFGSKGDNVKILQGKLGITQDGDFGKITLKKVKEFQASKGLTVDGVVGKNTWTALFS